MPYRLEYARTGRSKCHGPQPCAGSLIAKGALRLGSVVELQGNTVRRRRSAAFLTRQTMLWRHWGWYVAVESAFAHTQHDAAGAGQHLSLIHI